MSNPRRLPQRSSGSLLQDALRVQEALHIAANLVMSLEFSPNTRVNSLGASNLNGGMAVIMVSDWAAIPAHIPPPPYQNRDPLAGLGNVRARVDDFIDDYYSNYRVLPQDSSRTYLVVPLYQGRMVQPSQPRDTVANILNRNGLPGPRVVYYEVRPAGRRNPASGSIFIDARDSRHANSYVEDRPL